MKKYIGTFYIFMNVFISILDQVKENNVIKSQERSVHLRMSQLVVKFLSKTAKMYPLKCVTRFLIQTVMMKPKPYVKMSKN